jgi:outer membrane immunogenic protein
MITTINLKKFETFSVSEREMRHLYKSLFPLLMAAGSILVVSGSRAADFPGSRNSAVPMLAGTWSGLYGGLHLGYGFGRSRSADLSGFVGGANIGINAQTGPMVYGVEGDLNYTNIDYRAFADTFRQKWLGSIRARAGFSYERFMPFVTAGLAFTNGTMKAGGAKESNGHVGYVIGIGGEMMLTEKVSASVQFLHYRFNSQNYNVLPVSRNANIVTNELRIGMNYRF